MDTRTEQVIGRLVLGIVTALNASPPRVFAEEAEASLVPPSRLAEQLAGYIESTQHPSTGLPVSFFQSVDHALDGVAFTYDVAVASLALAHRGALPAAKRALATYLQMPLPSVRAFDFNTAYHVRNRRPTLEYQIHGGPMFWMAVALLRYAHVANDRAALQKGLDILEWGRTQLPHQDGGVAMSHRDVFSTVMSVENNWVYYAALRIADQMLPAGAQRQALRQERRGVRRWLDAHRTQRGAGDAVKALDVYTHALLVGPEAHVEDGPFADRRALQAWAIHYVHELEALFHVPGTALYDYTDEGEARGIGRERLAWLEGTEQVSVAYQTWANWFEQQGEPTVGKELRMKAALAHEQVLRYALSAAQGLAVPNTNALLTFRTFQDGWYARPRSEPALNGTNWAYLAEAAYNPFVAELPRRPR